MYQICTRAALLALMVQRTVLVKSETSVAARDDKATAARNSPKYALDASNKLNFFMLEPAACGGQHNPISSYVDLAVVPSCTPCANDVQIDTYCKGQNAQFEPLFNAEQPLQLLITDRLGMHLNDTTNLLSQSRMPKAL